MLRYRGDVGLADLLCIMLVYKQGPTGLFEGLLPLYALC